MEKRVREFVTENELLMPEQTIGAAVSGGPDSMALLHCLCSLAPLFSCSVACVHFEHGIRGQESLDDADFVEKWCGQHNIPFYMGAADVPALAQEWGVSKETAAKRAREAFFLSLVENGEVDVIATGHHMDDNAESVLMHILRGSGTDGLKGIHAKRDFLVRPLLCVTHEEILEYLLKHDISFVEDRTNRDTEHTRNYVRNVLLPQIRERINPDAAGALNRLSQIAEDDSDFIFAQAKEAYKSCASKKDDKVIIDLETFLGLAPAVEYRILKLACAGLHITQDIENVHIRSVMRLAKSGRTGTRVNLSNDLCAEVEYGLLVIRFSARRVNYEFRQEFDLFAKNELPDGSEMVCRIVDHCDFENEDEFTAYLDADRLSGRITVRTRYAGDMIHPLGSGGTKKLKDYFIDKKLPREAREKTPLLADGNRILWAVGLTISDDVKVTEQTEKIWQIKYYKKQGEESCSTT